MNRRELVLTFKTELDSTAMGSEFHGQILADSYGRVWKSKIDEEEVARLAVVGIGPLGARTTQILSKTEPDLSCHEIQFNPQSNGLAEMKAILTVVRSSDLLFIVSGFDDPQCEVIFKVVADSAREVGVPIIGVVPDNQCYISVLPLVTSIWPVSHRSFGGDLASVTPSTESREEWTEYALRHLVCTLTNILTHKGLIGIAYEDTVDILKSGTLGRLAVGVASEQVSIADASLIALGLLAGQGAAIQIATGVIVYLAGSNALLTMDEFDATAITIREGVAEGVGVIVGLQFDKASGNNAMVTLMVLSNAECDVQIDITD